MFAGFKKLKEKIPTLDEIQRYIANFEPESKAEVKADISYSALIDLSEKNPKLKLVLSSPQAEKFWLQQLKKLDKPVLPFVSVFDQAKGHYYFAKMLEIRKASANQFSDKEKIELLRSEQCGNFHALRESQFYYLLQLNQSSDAAPWLEKLTSQAEKAGKLHLTPGHLLAATSYIAMGQYYKTKNEINFHDAAYFSALKHLYLAKMLVDVSENTISNAYFKETIEAAFKKGYASVFDIPFKDFDELIKSFIEKTHVNSAFVESILHLAEQEAATIKIELKPRLGKDLSI